jgi:hypothetical protein
MASAGAQSADLYIGHVLRRLDVVRRRVTVLVMAGRAADATPDDPYVCLYLSDERVDRLLQNDRYRSQTTPGVQTPAQLAERCGLDDVDDRCGQNYRYLVDVVTGGGPASGPRSLRAASHRRGRAYRDWRAGQPPRRCRARRGRRTRPAVPAAGPGSIRQVAAATGRLDDRAIPAAGRASRRPPAQRRPPRATGLARRAGRRPGRPALPAAAAVERPPRSGLLRRAGDSARGGCARATAAARRSPGHSPANVHRRDDERQGHRRRTQP